MSNIPFQPEYRVSRMLSLVLLCLFVTVCTSCKNDATVVQGYTLATPTNLLVTKTPSQSQYPFTATPTDVFSFADSFGDGYISRILIEDFNTSEPKEIIEHLLIQWFEHYKSESKDKEYNLDDYMIEEITLKKDYFRPQYEIIAKVIFLVKPVSTQNGWISFMTGGINDNWQHSGLTFGVFRDGEYLRLRLLPGWGT